MRALNQGGSLSVEVRIPTVFRKFTAGESVVDLQPGTIADLIEELDEQFPGMKKQLLAGEGQLHRFVNVYVNDEDARYLDRLDTQVS